VTSIDGSRNVGGQLAMIDLPLIVAEWVPWMQSRADALDRDAAFPVEEFDLLREIGARSPPLPVCGHVGVGQLASLLVLVGQGNPLT
jgi:hypothetical protein